MHSLVKLTQILMTYQHMRRFLVSKAEQRVEFVPSPQLLNQLAVLIIMRTDQHQVPQQGLRP